MVSLCVRYVAGNSATNNLCEKSFNTTKNYFIILRRRFFSDCYVGKLNQKKNLFGEKSCRSSFDFRVSLFRDVEELSEDPKKSDLIDGVVVKRHVNRCSSCRRNVGLIENEGACAAALAGGPTVPPSTGTLTGVEVFEPGAGSVNQETVASIILKI